MDTFQFIEIAGSHINPKLLSIWGTMYDEEDYIKKYTDVPKWDKITHMGNMEHEKSQTIFACR